MKIEIITKCDVSALAYSVSAKIDSYKTVEDWCRVAEYQPIVSDMLIITAGCLPFTASNINRLYATLNSNFYKLRGKLFYIVQDKAVAKSAKEFFEKPSPNVQVEVVVINASEDYTGIYSVITGAARTESEGAVTVTLTRQRASEKVLEQAAKTLNSRFTSDFEYKNAEVPQEVVNVVSIGKALSTEVKHLYGSWEETVPYAYLLAVADANEKTLIIEPDLEYHTLTDLAFRVGHPKLRIMEIQQLIHKPKEAIYQLRTSKTPVIIGTRQRYNAVSYEFLQDWLVHEMDGYFNRIILFNDLFEYTVNPTVSQEAVIPASYPRALKMLDKFEWEDGMRFVCLNTKKDDSEVSAEEMKVLLSSISNTELDINYCVVDGFKQGQLYAVERS